jgi:hypothetical protein
MAAQKDTSKRDAELEVLYAQLEGLSMFDPQYRKISKRIQTLTKNMH